MDSLSQAALGAAVGYAVSGRKMGKKAMLWGAFAGTLPDLDFIPTLPFSDNFIYLKYHRGFSHSLVFTLIGPWLASLFNKALFWLFFWAISTHILLDCFTSWGTQVFWPFAERVSFNAIFIVDPAYTVPLIVALIATSFSKSNENRSRFIKLGLIVSTSYLILALGMKGIMHVKFTNLFESKNIPITRYTSRPTPFNIFLWSANAETEEGYYYAMISIFDKNHPDKLFYVKKNHHLNKDFHDKRSKELLSYTKGYYVVETTHEGIVVRDLRYGFLGDPFLNGKNYVFSYYLSKDEAGKTQLNVQNPRPENTDELLGQLWERLKGI